MVSGIRRFYTVRGLIPHPFLRSSRSYSPCFAASSYYSVLRLLRIASIPLHSRPPPSNQPCDAAIVSKVPPGRTSQFLPAGTSAVSCQPWRCANTSFGSLSCIILAAWMRQFLTTAKTLLTLGRSPWHWENCFATSRFARSGSIGISDLAGGCGGDSCDRICTGGSLAWSDWRIGRSWRR